MQNKTLPADIAHLADLTSTSRIRAYWEKDPAICYVVTVLDPELSLEEVGATLINNDITTFSDWILSGQVTQNPPKDSNDACYCIRIEPYYLIKLTGGKYE